MGTTRREFLVAAAALPAAMAKPAIAQGARNTLRWTPNADLSQIDPLASTANLLRAHSFMVFDTLYAVDAQGISRPQMAEGHEISQDGRVWTIRLRSGLRFHDGEPVRPRDCIASLRRWGARDGLGGTLMAVVDAMEEVDDRTIRIALKRPFPLLPDAIGKMAMNIAFMMPERLAVTPPTTPINEAIGSGPFKFAPGEWVPGSRAVWEKFKGYVPRQEPPSWGAGGKVVYLDRVEWVTIPDAGTAAAALSTGEIDWWEEPTSDLLPLLSSWRDVKLTTLDPIGSMAFMRFNTRFPPFDKPAVRAVVGAAVQQNDYLQAIVGSADLYTVCRAFFPCGLPSSTGAGGDVMKGDLEAARKALATSGYSGEKVIIISPADIPTVVPMGQVTADLLQRLGMNVDLQVMDWGAMLARRASKEPPERQGWSIFHGWLRGSDVANPALSMLTRGDEANPYPGWFRSERLAKLRDEWFAASDDAGRLSITKQIEQTAFQEWPIVPLGLFRQPTAHRSNITGILESPAPLAWNIKKG